MKHDGNALDDTHTDLFMDHTHQITSTSQLLSTSFDNINSNSQSGFAHYFSSASFGEEGQENNEMISPTALANSTDPSTMQKKRKKSEKDLKWVSSISLIIRTEQVDEN